MRLTHRSLVPSKLLQNWNKKIVQLNAQLNAQLNVIFSLKLDTGWVQREVGCWLQYKIYALTWCYLQSVILRIVSEENIWKAFNWTFSWKLVSNSMAENPLKSESKKGSIERWIEPTTTRLNAQRRSLPKLAKTRSFNFPRTTMPLHYPSTSS